MAEEKKIWDFLVSNGLTAAGAAGLMGNLYAESGLFPNNMENAYEKKLGYTDATYTAAVDNGTYANFVKDAVGYGLAQWTYYTRKQALLNYAKSKSKSIGDLDMQLEFLLQELKTSFPGVLNVLKTTSSIQTASDKVLLDFERPANQSDSVKSQRALYGQNYYNKYAGGGTTMAVTADDVLKVAIAEIGYHEKASNSNLDSATGNSGSNNWTKYARDLAAAGYYNGNKNGYAWCDVFVDWCFYQACGKSKSKAEAMECQTGDCGAGCDFSAQYYKNAGRFSTTPQKGDQIFFKQGSSIVHTGLVEKVDNNYVYTVEGNTSDQVARRTYSRSSSSIYGYGHPKYDGSSSSSSSSTSSSSSSSASTSSSSTSTNGVKTFQSYLNATYSAGLTVDGEYGPLTKKAAIKAYQKAMNSIYNSGLVVDGDFGTLSKAAINKNIIKKGANNQVVYVIQGLLQVHGYDTGGLDGDFGTKTDTAVRAFQKAKGLIVDGEVGADTLTKLFA